MRADLIGSLLVGSLLACGGEDDGPRRLPLPMEENVRAESYGVRYLFSDSARVTAELNATHVVEKLEKIPGAEKEAETETVHYLDQGVVMNFFSAPGEVSSVITSDRGNFRQTLGMAELRGNVVVTNYKEETLKTEQLFWNKRKDSIYTTKFVRIETPDKIITGSKGLQANTAFTAYTIYGIRGEVEMKEE